ncbi:hypothetical protein AVEN_81932-1 [Araneus ventricosus]|uniref:Uncharacterized protein n=1 Tax=Araneus ventricosus TaxID=182803 RepID=A0A4Y2GHQ5_ARAVE|nr:hypothetical protein AVEN_81932-1 [Araneus ventricosus]
MTGHHDSIVRHCGSCTRALISRCPCSNPRLSGVRPVIGVGPKSLTTVMCPRVDESHLTYTAACLPRARSVSPGPAGTWEITDSLLK